VHRTTELEARQHRKHDNYFDKRRSLPVNDFTSLGTGFRSSTLPAVMQNDRISPWSLTTRCNLHAQKGHTEGSGLDSQLFFGNEK
jgi:hypothetical protein